MKMLNKKQFTVWAILLSISVCKVTAITRPPSMYIQPDHDVYYKAGETVPMPCVADGVPQPKYTWVRNKIDFNPSGNDGRMVQLPNVGTIVINRPEDKDEAIYQCFADNGYGKSATININLREAKLDNFANGDDVYHRPSLGEQLTLNCVLPDSVPSPEFYWAVKEQHGGYVAINYDARVTLDHEARLRITNVKAEDYRDGRAYACMAMNPYVRRVTSGVQNKIIPQGTIEVLRTVSYMWASPTDHYGLYGDEFKLKCIFAGNPTPDVHWVKTKGGAMSEGVQTTSFGQELVFSSLEFEDAGEYECWATNTQSSKREFRTFQIRVESRPYWTHEPVDIELGVGGTATFTCKANAVPEPEIFWFVNSVKLSESKDERVTNGRFSIVRPDTVVFVNVTNDDAMVIQCNVTNKHGYIFGDSYVNVLSEAPTILQPPEADKVTAEGLSVNVLCRTTGKPDPQITWFVEGRQITGGRYKTQFNGDLLIKNVVLSDAGMYMCQAENKFGKMNATGRLSVRRKTLIEQKPLDLEVNAGTDAKFTCSGTTDPEEVHNLQILWEKDNKPITPNDQRMTTNNQDNSLTISGTISRDSGTYSCIATNGLDSSRAVAMLIVKDRPDAPVKVRVEKCEVNATISFTPGSFNNAPIQYFIIQYNTSFNPDQWNFGLKAPATAKQAQVPLSPYANFTYRVIAYNKIGESDPSFPSPTGCKTNQALPTKNPENLRTIGYKKGFLYMEWTPMPMIQQNGPGFQYLLQIKKQGLDDSTTQPFTLDNWRLDRYEIPTGDTYQPYEITLKARNGKGEAGNAKTIIGYSGEDIPNMPPTDLTADMINITSATLSWSFDMSTIDIPDTPIRGEFKGFKIQYWQQNYKEYTIREWDVSAEEAKRNAIGNRVHAVVENLLPFTYLEARVSVMNNFYVGRPTDIIRFQTKPGVPGPVERLNVRSIGTNHFNLEWNEPLDRNGEIIGYDIGYQSVHGLDLGKMQDREPQIRDTYQTSAMLSGLLANTKYRVYIWAITAQGRGDSYFIELVTTAQSSPQAPRYTIESVGENYINVTWWLNPYVKSGTVIFVEYRKLDAPEWLKSTDEVINLWKNITDLESGTTYEVRVVATNGNSRSVSSIEEVTTIGIAAASSLSANFGWFIGMLLAVIVVIAVAAGVYCVVKNGLGFKPVERDEPNSYSDTSRIPAKMDEPKGFHNDYYDDRDSYHGSAGKSDPPPNYADYARDNNYDYDRRRYSYDDEDYDRRDGYDKRDSYDDRRYNYDRDSDRDDRRDSYYDRDSYQERDRPSAPYDKDYDHQEPNKFDKYGAPRSNYDDQVEYSDRSSRHSDAYDDRSSSRQASGAGPVSSSFV